MATTKYFGETKTTRATKRTARKRKTTTRRTKRANTRTTRTATTATAGVVMIPVPASLAFQVGLTLGRASVQGFATR